MAYRSFKYRLFPNRTQLRELETTLETHRRLYNQALDERRLCWETANTSIDFAFQSNRFTVLRRSNRWYSQLNGASGRQTLRLLDKAFQAFFRMMKAGEKPGYPRFKSRDRFSSWTYSIPKGGGARLVDGKLRLQFIGTVRIKLHRPVEGTIKTVQVKRECDKWFAIFTCEVSGEPAEHTGPSVGIDVGLNHFVVTSEGEEIDSPKPLAANQVKLRRAQRGVSRRKKGGNRRRKAVKHLRRIHLKVRNVRRDFHHKVARKLVDRYSVIAVESLNVQGMVRNHRLARSISDAGWSQFIDILKRKAEIAGVRVQEVSARNTSQQCSACGEIVRKSLAVRVHRCACGCVLDRDHNAAINILARAEPSGLNVAGCRKRVPRSRQLLLLE